MRRVTWGLWVLALAALALLSSCTGIISGDTQAVEDQKVVAQRLARLSHAEWENTVVDLLGLPEPTGAAAAFATDPLGAKTFDNDAAALSVSPALWNDYQIAAEALAARVTSDALLLEKLLPPNLPTPPTERALVFIRSFGLRAYRRPLEPQEIAERLALFEAAPSSYPELDPFVAGVRANLAAFLQSPHFNYRVLLGTAEAGADSVTLSAWEVASQLSYAVWNSMPDEELFRAAAAGELGTEAGVNAQLTRLIAAPRARATLIHFFEQLYESRQYEHLDKDRTLYPDFSLELARDMQGELQRFTDDVTEHGGGLRELLTSTTSFVTPALARLYGLPASLTTGQDAAGFSRVELDPTERAGLLTRSGFLAWKASSSQPGTIQRGVFITRRIICRSLGNPPPSAQGKTFAGQTTNRERVEALTGAGTCGAGCHGAYINPLGFAFEHYGALGEYRASDAGSPIDASGSYAFAEGTRNFRDAGELGRALADASEVHACFSGYLLAFLLGRELTPGEDELLTALASRSLLGASTRELVQQALSTPTFRRRPLTVENHG